MFTYTLQTLHNFCKCVCQENIPNAITPSAAAWTVQLRQVESMESHYWFQIVTPPSAEIQLHQIRLRFHPCPLQPQCVWTYQEISSFRNSTKAIWHQQSCQSITNVRSHFLLMFDVSINCIFLPVSIGCYTALFNNGWIIALIKWCID